MICQCYNLPLATCANTRDAHAPVAFPCRLDLWRVQARVAVAHQVVAGLVVVAVAVGRLVAAAVALGRLVALAARRLVVLAAMVGDHLPQRSPMVGVETASTLPSKPIHRFGQPIAATISTALLARFRCLLST